MGKIEEDLERDYKNLGKELQRAKILKENDDNNSNNDNEEEDDHDNDKGATGRVKRKAQVNELELKMKAYERQMKECESLRSKAVDFKNDIKEDTIEFLKMEKKNEDLTNLVTSIWTEDYAFRKFLNSNLACLDLNPKSVPNLYDEIKKRLASNGKNYEEFSLNEMKHDSLGKEVLQKLGEYENNDNSDEEDLTGRIEYTDANFTCPISRTKFTNPVKSAKCNHFYEKEYILQMLRSSRVTKCPVPGCRHDVRPNDLETDKKFLRIMNRFLQRKQAEKNNLQVQNLDAETVDVHANAGDRNEDEEEVIN